MKKYLSINDKYDLINVTLQKATINGRFEPLLLDAFFNLNLIYLYTNIDFSEFGGEGIIFDELELFDAIYQSGLLHQFLDCFEATEYKELYNFLIETVESRKKEDNSLINLINTVADKIPESMEQAAKLVEGFDPEKYQEVVEFAKVANGNRPIN